MHTIRLAAAFALALGLAAPALANPDVWKFEWPKTDFSRSSVEFREIMSGGPPKDGIPAIWDPTFIPVGRETRLDDREPVMTVEIAGAEPRAYPIRYLMWHEIVNDVVAGQPIAVTFCPLCNSGIVFDRRVKGELRSFGVSGKLRHSDMVMYDRETESWWQQAIGVGIVGRHMGDRLTQLPAWMEGWAEYRARNPQGLVMDEPEWRRSYGHNPYERYDSSPQPFLFYGEMPPHGIEPLARVVAVAGRAWPLERLREAGEIREAGFVLRWNEGQASALDAARIGEGREVGTVRVRNGAGQDVAFDIPFAFAFHAFHPNGQWMLGN